MTNPKPPEAALVDEFERACRAAGVPDNEIWARSNDLRLRLTALRQPAERELLREARDELRGAHSLMDEFGISAPMGVRTLPDRIDQALAKEAGHGE